MAWSDLSLASRQRVIEDAAAEIRRTGGTITGSADPYSDDEPRAVTGGFSLPASTLAARSYFIRPAAASYHWEQELVGPSMPLWGTGGGTTTTAVVTQGTTTTTGSGMAPISLPGGGVVPASGGNAADGGWAWWLVAAAVAGFALAGVAARR